MKASINWKKITSKKAQVSYTQILILIISMFAFCYLISSETDSISAQEIEGYSCCEKTKDGKYCQFAESSQCALGFQSTQTKCDETGFCELGCCYSPNTGLCNENTPKRSCGGEWDNDGSCNIPECQKSCCVLGNNALWTTRGNCEKEASSFGIEPDFRTEINSEVECIFLSEKDEEGSCVLGETCRFISRENCRNSHGIFNENAFCSDIDLENKCIKHKNKGCIDGKESVYWFDSCGNREEIAEECSLFSGNYCGLTGGDYNCKSVDCIVDGKKRKNGESWCEYEGTIGNGKDIAGSRHVRHSCYMGEERIEPCEDYRNQICVQADADLDNGKTFSEASCRINNWRNCLEYNTLEDKEKMKKECNENPDCFIKNTYVDKKFTFDFCSPKYPPGFDLTNEASGENAGMICSMGTQKCTIVEVKEVGGWDCKVNCKCKTAAFTEQMNELCTSLGDCGAYVNVAGKVTNEGYYVTGSSRAKKLSDVFLNGLKQYAREKSGQKAEPGNISFFLKGSSSSKEEDIGKMFKNAAGVYGIGFAAQVASYFFSHASVSISTAMSNAVTYGASTTPGFAATLGSFGNALAAVGSALMAASIISMAFGVSYKEALIIVGVGVAVLALFVNIVEILWQIAPYLLVIFFVLKLAGIGDTRTKTVTFTCLPWQPPNGGDDCSKCNTNDALEVPCTKYRCKSLGQTCELINIGTEQEKCINNNPNDVSSPRISPLLGEVTEGYEYYNIKDNGFEIVNSKDKKCISEFTPVTFGIKTDKPSQCVIGDNPVQSFAEMENNYFGGGNLYLTNHTTILNMPSPESFKNQYNLTDEQIKKIGEINFYVKCKSVNGKTNDASYTIRTCIKPGPDMTAPNITKIIPETNSYISYNETEKNLSIWINEPANCKWSSEDRDYSLMENSFNCQNDLEDYSLYGWPCSAKLTNLDKNNKFYIRCQDTSNNKNNRTQSDIYSIKKSASELKIDEIKPAKEEEIFSGVEPLTVELQVKTSGGAENGKALCYYNFGNSEIKFKKTDADYHNQIFNSIIRGNYNLNIKCEDIAGNNAESSTSFEISIDNSGPNIIRAYYDSGLKIATNEKAECRYDFESFAWDNATIMSGDGITHLGEWKLKNYQIQCKDEYGNKGEKIKVRAYSLIS